MRLKRLHPVPLCPQSEDRQGTATVEFALVTPLFLTIVLGIGEMSCALSASQNLSTAVREGGRLAASNMSEQIPQGSTANAKVIQDIKNMLAASGIDSTTVNVTITYADGADAGKTFDLQDPNNYLKYFKITAKIDYSQVSMGLVHIMKGQSLSSSVVFRLGYSALSS